ncbi:MAG: tetratricopeptide repeat protein [Salinivirgaceae bacterium]
MKRFKIIYVVIILLNSTLVFANGQQQLVDSAANFYAASQFEKAIAAYHQVIDNGYESAELYYNLGNAYYKSNKIPQAITNYERALKLAPGDEDILFNLQLANTHVVDKIEVLPEFFLTSWWNRFVQLFSSNQWALISISTFIAGLVLLLIFFLSGRVVARKLSFWMAVLLIFVSIFTFNFSRKQKWFALNEPEAIIMTPSMVVKSAPSESGTELFLIHEGLKVKVTDKLGDWREIKLSDGNKGWVKQDDLIVI